MTFVVTESCIKCKYMDCVEVCPVDCFHEGPNFLTIDPEECIDCTLCEPECPVEAIFSEEELPAGQEHFKELNAELAKQWRFFLLRNHRPLLGELGIQLLEMLLTRGQLLLGEDRLDRAFRLAQGAVDALLGIDGEEVRPLVEAVDRANLDAIHVLALDAAFGDDKSHSVSSRGAVRAHGFRRGRAARPLCHARAPRVNQPSGARRSRRSMVVKWCCSRPAALSSR